MKLRREPILVGLACFGPFVLALLIYFGPVDSSVLPVVENPERELIARGRSLPPITLRTAGGELAAEPWAAYRWSLIYVAGPRSAMCSGELERLAQVHGALGHERHRLRRVLLHAGGGCARADDPALLIGTLDAGREPLWNELFDLSQATGRFFVADPLGNLVAAYPAGANRKALLEDLERLLDVSRIG